MILQKQPLGFSIFFLTEMWERYGFYVLQSLLVFYTLDKLHLSDSQTYALVGSFTAFAYTNSILGGVISDKFMGYDKAIFVGAILLIIGYFTITISHGGSSLLIGLAIITAGTGMLKPNISSLLSVIYEKQPKQKEIGYTLFYIGIYFGAIGGSFIGGYIKEHLGWVAVFSSATFGLLFACITFVYGCKKFKLEDCRDIPQNITNYIKSAFLLGSFIIITYFGLKYTIISDALFIIIAFFSVVFLLKNIIIHKGHERNKLIAFSILICFSILYWAIFFQQFFSISLCTARVTELTLPKSSLTAFESFGIIIFGPLVSYLLSYLKKRNKSISIPAKFSLSFLFNFIAFGVLILSLKYAYATGHKVAQIFIIISYLTIALGELFISPTGLSMVSTLVPRHLNGTMMGIFLVSLGFGGKLAGIFASYSISQLNDSVDKLQLIYINSFSIYCGISFAVFMVCILAIKPLNKLIY